MYKFSSGVIIIHCITLKIYFRNCSIPCKNTWTSNILNKTSHNNLHVWRIKKLRNRPCLRSVANPRKSTLKPGEDNNEVKNGHCKLKKWLHSLQFSLPFIISPLKSASTSLLWLCVTRILFVQNLGSNWLKFRPTIGPTGPTKVKVNSLWLVGSSFRILHNNFQK